MEKLIYLQLRIDWVNPNNHISFRKHGPCTIYNSGAVYFSQIDENSSNRVRGPCGIMPDGEIMYQSASRGYYHRIDGPAIINADGTREYWIEDNELSPEEFFVKYGVL